MNLVKNTNVVRELVRLTILRIIEYKVNFVIDVFFRFLEFGVFFFFWKSILDADGSIPGWDIQGLLVLYAFRQIFISFINTIGDGVYYLEHAISRGEIDKYLGRPVEPWLIILGEHAFISIGGLAAGIGALVMAQLFFGANILTPIFPLLLLMVLLATFISTLFGLTIGCAAFWFGRTRMFNYVNESFWAFEAYPMTLFPGGVQTLTSFIVPFLFSTTIPALAAVGAIPFETVLEYLGIEIVILAFNFLIFSFVWRRGVKRYESSGG